MGAHQSSQQEPDATSTRACYYDILGIDRQATDDELKKAYRKKALDLHPDRNLNDVETATEKFAEVQAAYEILSDPQERAWYDSHRDAILSGHDRPGDSSHPSTFRNVRLTSAEEIVGLVRKFNATVPFDDGPTGFFCIIRVTFERLAHEEEAASEFVGLDLPCFPSFGSSSDDYHSVVKPFYAAWSNFSTKKPFSWKDKHRVSDAPDRQVRRRMEKENRKSREDAMRDFNEAVRFLVSFARKRDPRCLANTQTDTQRQQSLREAAAAQAARSRAANREKMSTYSAPSWVSHAHDIEIDQDFNSESSEDDSVTKVLECVICNKLFKSIGQFEAHERSKKHVKAVQALRRQLDKEDDELQIDNATDPLKNEGSTDSESSDTVKVCKATQGMEARNSKTTRQLAKMNSEGYDEESQEKGIIHYVGDAEVALYCPAKRPIQAYT
ncbi:hypothetical protein DCS_07878 [Drechmeria coniospora]|uniref:J domain-containing protein n=1 Tax=Drechmeria coniospora TaxID=98403 RepID=A0A151GFN4_DRECN|nr:hypothetical protein DCS_07878 [Drechmeria coniospora]KYK55913.1 hypothetical protein DCS_07878 [Drechmeria coniospora]